MKKLKREKPSFFGYKAYAFNDSGDLVFIGYLSVLIQDRKTGERLGYKLPISDEEEIIRIKKSHGK